MAGAVWVGELALASAGAVALIRLTSDDAVFCEAATGFDPLALGPPEANARTLNVPATSKMTSKPATRTRGAGLLVRRVVTRRGTPRLAYGRRAGIQRQTETRL